MKNITKIVAFITVFAFISFSGRAFVSAQNNPPPVPPQPMPLGGVTMPPPPIDDGEGMDQGEGQDGPEDSNDDGQSDDEQGLFSFIQNDQKQSQPINLPEVNKDSLQTYADVVSIIKSYEDELAKIQDNTNINDQASTLSTGEKALFSTLLNKHMGEFKHLDSRTTETVNQLKQLSDLLTPLGTTPIASSYGIKGLLVDELNNYRDIIKNISEVDDLNSQILEEEVN